MIFGIFLESLMELVVTFHVTHIKVKNSLTFIRLIDDEIFYHLGFKNFFFAHVLTFGNGIYSKIL